MFTLIQPFINLLLFRAGPQDMPASRTVLKYVIVACFITDLLGAVGILGLNLAAVLSAGQIALYAVFIYFLLRINQKTERWLQTLVALFGALALINLVSYPFIQNLQVFEEGKLIITPGILVVGLLQLWFFIIMVRVLRDAMEISIGRAALLTFLIINIVPMVLSSVISILGLSPPSLTFTPPIDNP